MSEEVGQREYGGLLDDEYQQQLSLMPGPERQAFNSFLLHLTIGRFMVNVYDALAAWTAGRDWARTNE